MHPKESKFNDWLQWFAADRVSEPFAMPLSGRAATDGRMAVIVRDGGPVFPLPPGRFEKVPDKLEKMLALPPAESQTFMLADLTEAAGDAEHPSEEICPDCKGKKEVTHVCDCDLCPVEKQDCDTCEGSRVIIDETHGERAGTFWGVPFDSNRLTYILAHVPHTEGQVKVRLVIDGDRAKDLISYLILATGTWQAVLVCLGKEVLDAAAKQGRILPEITAANLLKAPL